jgi:ribosomal protein L34
MNNASKDLPHHLSVLLERLQHPTDYEKALHYFLEEFAGDADFVMNGDVVQTPVLYAVIRQIIKGASGQMRTFLPAKVFRMHGHGFHHGSGSVEGRAVLYFHFESVNKGLAAIIPGYNGPVDVARFSLPATLPVDTSKN